MKRREKELKRQTTTRKKELNYLSLAFASLPVCQTDWLFFSVSWRQWSDELLRMKLELDVEKEWRARSIVRQSICSPTTNVRWQSSFVCFCWLAEHPHLIGNSQLAVYTHCLIHCLIYRHKHTALLIPAHCHLPIFLLKYLTFLSLSCSLLSTERT